MFDFSELIAAIRLGCDAGARAVSEKNHELIERYFDKISDDLHAENADAGGEDGDGSAGVGDSAGSGVPSYRPKLVALAFPRETAQGPKEHHVYVPLISLIPLSELTISELEVHLNLDVVEKDNVLKVGFAQVRPASEKPRKKSKDDAPDSGGTHFNAKIKISFAETGSPQGLTSIIEGYNKALRAQVPG